MAEIRRFETFRFLGARDTMTVYDTDDALQAAVVATRLDEDDLLDANLVQTFGPDTLAEARNRGFRSINPPVSRDPEMADG